jgi:hypothetical protein
VRAVRIVGQAGAAPGLGGGGGEDQGAREREHSKTHGTGHRRSQQLAARRVAARNYRCALGEPDFREVFVSTWAGECERRHPKGLYAKARAGKLPGFTGVSTPYEPPEDADLEVDTAHDDGDAAVARLLETLGV